jgi:catechol 2,3-dioxygenase-like lactoylglutathione lyase family enzyme
MLDHVTITVSDLPASAAFYSTVLGRERLGEFGVAATDA